jgi:hypothetical protein
MYVHLLYLVFDIQNFRILKMGQLNLFCDIDIDKKYWMIVVGIIFQDLFF